jgi:hypothetical protein
VEWASLIKSLDVPLINVAIRDVSESSRSSPSPMQPNPKPGFSDENNCHELMLTWIIMWLPTWMMMWQPTWMTRGSLRGWHVAPMWMMMWHLCGRWHGTYVDDDVAPMWTMTWHLHGWWRVTYVDDDVTIIAAQPAHKKSGPQFFQTILNYNSRTWSPIPM